MIRARWKLAKEFMFWGCFSYDKKGPCHIWKKETAAEKKVTTGLARLNLARNPPRRRPVWKFTKERGAITRESKRYGIDWWLYQQKVLKPKLIPFAQECLKDRPRTIVQDDIAPAHASQYRQSIFDAA